MPDATAAPEESRQAWVVVWACFTALAVIFGVSYSFAAFFASLTTEFSARRADVSLVFGLCGLVYFTGGAQALFHTAASCFARAGDCQQAWATYSALFPQTATTPEAAALMPGIIREAYDSSILFCGAKQRDAPIPQSPPQRR
mgnify:CR=1 FL=1